MQIDDIVTVIDPKDRFYDHQGQVKAIIDDGDEGGHIEVEIVSQEWYSPDGLNFRFFKRQLRKDDDWSAFSKAIKIFGADNFRVVNYNNSPLNKGELCQHRDCPLNRAKKILVNIWGSVCEVEVCEEHADQFHGYRMDDFPWRQKIRS